MSGAKLGLGTLDLFGLRCGGRRALTIVLAIGSTRSWSFSLSGVGAATVVPCAVSSGSGFDGYSFTLSFKGVLLEGLEVVFIVLTFGANQHHIGIAANAAAVAVAAVVVLGLAARALKGPIPSPNQQRVALRRSSSSRWPSCTSASRPVQCRCHQS